jgi:alpha-1,2-mannosyltransferase
MAAVMRRRVVVQVFVVAALGLAVFWFLSVAAVRHGYFDLKVYYGAINFWAHGHGGVYDYLKVNSEYGFTYPPFAALVMVPMALVPWGVAITINLVATVSATLIVLFWLVDPMARRYGWSRWFTLAIAAELAAAFEPLRETVNFGQVNMLLLFLVGVDLLYLVRRKHPLGGVLIGLAAAIKLTPGIFILYLLVTRRWRAALVSMASALAATVLAGAVSPDLSREFWTDALWNTSRVGSQSFISNQSVNGLVARLSPLAPSRPLWLVLSLVVLALWAWRVRRAAAVGDDMAGFILTGIAGCLVSPFTWVHHLVWLLPAIILIIDRGLKDATGRRRVALLVFALGMYVLLSSRLVWQYAFHFGGWGLLFANAYVYASLALLLVLPLSVTQEEPDRRVEDVGQPVESDLEPAPVDEPHDLVGIVDRDR